MAIHARLIHATGTQHIIVNYSTIFYEMKHIIVSFFFLANDTLLSDVTLESEKKKTHILLSRQFDVTMEIFKMKKKTEK
jgi:hypothetical protein